MTEGCGRAAEPSPREMRALPDPSTAVAALREAAR